MTHLEIVLCIVVYLQVGVFVMTIERLVCRKHELDGLQWVLGTLLWPAAFCMLSF